jgi:hypothetical protein
LAGVTLCAEGRREMKFGTVHINVAVTNTTARSKACFELIETLTKFVGKFTIGMTFLQIG